MHSRARITGVRRACTPLAETDGLVARTPTQPTEDGAANLAVDLPSLLKEFTSPPDVSQKDNDDPSGSAPPIAGSVA